MARAFIRHRALGDGLRSRRDSSLQHALLRRCRPSSAQGRHCSVCMSTAARDLRYGDGLSDEELFSRVQNLHRDGQYGLFTQEEYRAFVRERYGMENGQLQALEPFSSYIDSNATPNQARHVHDGVWELPETTFTEKFVREVSSELSCFEQWCHDNDVPIRRPNSMNRRGLGSVNDMQLEATMDTILSSIIRPFATELLPQFFSCSLDSHHSFSVDYDLSGDTELGFHVDDAEVTLNLCLESDATGGELHFSGKRCALHRSSTPHPWEPFDYTHRRGIALLHAGSHRHLVKPLISGWRRNLIIWARSSKARETHYHECPSWCGVHHSS